MFCKSMSEARDGIVTMPLSEYDGIIRALFAQGDYPDGGYVLYDDDHYTPSVTIAKPIRKEEETDV